MGKLKDIARELRATIKQIEQSIIDQTNEKDRLLKKLLEYQRRIAGIKDKAEKKKNALNWRIDPETKMLQRIPDDEEE